MNDLSEHYRLLLGLDSAWDVADVDLLLEENRVEIRLVHRGGKVDCPECGAACTIADHAPERTWRHLDTMQFETRLVARTPRAQCGPCGVKTIAVPWSGKHSRFTLLFEAFAVRVLLACNNIKRAAVLLRLDWDTAHAIMERAVERGLIRREIESLAYAGMDEKNFHRGQSYVSLLTDLEGARVLEVVEGRDEAAANALWQSLGMEQKQQVQAVAIDMSSAYRNAAAAQVPQAEVVHDKFHVSKHLNESVDKVRRQEHKKLQAAGDKRLTGTKQLWLFGNENLSDETWLRFAPLKDSELKTARAWAIKEQFRWFWEYRYAGHARTFFKEWYGWATRSRLEPVVKVAKMLKRHEEGLFSYFRHRITNALTEGFNSRIQELKSAARGFRAFRNYRTRILFYCGKLQLLPDVLTHEKT